MRGEQNNILFPVRILWANNYSWGGTPNPALLFSLQKSKQKASTPGSHKIYFYPGILQLPTVKQVKCLYNSVKNKFYKRLQRGALNGNGKTAKTKGKKHKKSTKIHTAYLIGSAGKDKNK
jgi:hypothetical protein